MTLDSNGAGSLSARVIRLHTDLIEFSDRGHSLTIDSGWRAVADERPSWLAKQGM